MITDRLLDRSSAPVQDDFLAAIGPDQAPLWDQLTDFITQTYDIQPEITPGGKKTGWFIKFKKGGRPLCDFNPTADGFNVLVVLGKAETAEALACQETLGAHVREILVNARVFHDGCWLFIPVKDAADIPDIQKLLLIKRKPPRKKANA